MLIRARLEREVVNYEQPSLKVRHFYDRLIDTLELKKFIVGGIMKLCFMFDLMRGYLAARFGGYVWYMVT